MSEHPKLPDIVEEMRMDVLEHHVGTLDLPPIRYLQEDIRWEAPDEIERLRTSSIGWEEAIEAAAKVADETAALEDKHDRYEGWRAAHDIAQTIRSLLPSSGRDGRKP